MRHHSKHKNWYTIIDESINMKFIVNFLIKDNIFSFQLGCDTKNTEFTDFFYTKTTEIALGRPIDKYLKLT